MELLLILIYVSMCLPSTRRRTWAGLKSRSAAVSWRIVAAQASQRATQRRAVKSGPRAAPMHKEKPWACRGFQGESADEAPSGLRRRRLSDRSAMAA
jgi:hypothetical protein